MLEKVQADRQAKLAQIRRLGIDPYGRRYETAEPIAEVLARFADGAEQSADVAGRLVLMRKMGKLIFAHVRDESAQMQMPQSCLATLSTSAPSGRSRRVTGWSRL